MSVSVLEKPAPASQAVQARRAVSVDVGYGYTKAVSANGRRACFPSVIAPATEDPLGGVLADGLGHRVRVRHLGGDPEEKLVGEAAARSMAAVTTLARNKPAEMHDLLVLAAAYLVGAGVTGGRIRPGRPGGGPAAGVLPGAEGYPGRQAAQDFRYVSVDGGEERYISFNRVLVLPQAAGAVAAYPELLPDAGLLGVVDVGQYTTDYLLLGKVTQQVQPRPVLGVLREHGGGRLPGSPRRGAGVSGEGGRAAARGNVGAGRASSRRDVRRQGN